MLNSLGDAVISTDVRGNIDYLNTVAEGLTGWTGAAATGRPFTEVCRIVDASTPERALNPVALAILENRAVALPKEALLIRSDGVEVAIEDSVAPIRDSRGEVAGAVMVFRDVSASRAESLRLSHLARYDALTNLPNRELMTERLTHAIALARRRGKQLAVLFLDVDHFKAINDSLGHAVGDRLLQTVSDRLLACVRRSDTVSRRGGDEFVILLSEVTHPRDVSTVAEAILPALGLPLHIGQHCLRITASIGIAICPDHGTRAETLIKHADIAMYSAKNRGRNTFRFFTPARASAPIEVSRRTKWFFSDLPDTRMG